MTTSKDEYKEVRCGDDPSSVLLNAQDRLPEIDELSIQYQEVLGRLDLQKEDTNMSICCYEEGDIFGLQC